MYNINELHDWIESDKTAYGWTTIDDCSDRGAMAFTVGGDSESRAQGRHECKGQNKSWPFDVFIAKGRID
jgi:hypothetical protein